MITLNLEFNPFIRGKGLWKFNNSLLYDADYVNIVKQKICDVKKQYCALVYNLDFVEKVETQDIFFRIDSQLFLETLLMEIRGKSISYSSYKKKENDKKETDLKNVIINLESNVDETSVDELEIKKQELEQLRSKKVKGKLVRSRIQWIEEGEKPTRYFCGLESRNFMSKIIPKVQKDNEVITNQQDILHELKQFYKTLYSKRDNSCSLKDLNEIFSNAQVPILSNEQKDSLEGIISVNEAAEALQKMKNNKSPGSDGFSSEFFKYFWKDLKFFVVNSLNYGYLVGELSVTQKQGIITCLPKGNKPRHFLKNWRPISLLNTVYKIGSAAIANRFKKVLDIIVDSDQTGFISGRYIGENVRLIYDIMQYTEEHDVPGLLLLIDFEKAFDSISWNFLINVLHFFNFGDSIINWVKVFYHNISSAVIQGGNLSDFFNIGRGCRQGDPLSPYLFIICAEILALKIRENDNIHGIEITRVEHKLSQFADDTSLILDGNEKSLQESLLELDWFARVSGLNINYSKTQLIWIGKKKYSNDVLCPDRELSWGGTSFKLLGINFDVDLNRIVKINYDEKLIQIKNIMKQWSRRNLTVIGRITVVKTLVIPVLNHLFVSLPNPSKTMTSQISDLLYEFVWNSRTHRVKRDVLVKDIYQGGLKMLDINSFIPALKSTWIRRIFQREKKWSNIVLSDVQRNKFFSCGTGYVKEICEKTNNLFWKDVFRAWEMIIKTEKRSDWEYFLSSPIWLNDNIKIGNKCVFNQHWFDHGIRFINDILNDDGSFMSFEQLQQCYNIDTNFLYYLSVITAVRAAGKCYEKFSNRLSSPFIPSHVQIFLKKYKGSQDMYRVLIKNNIVPTGQKKWCELENLINISWDNIFRLPFLVTKNTKLQWLQYRINHYTLATNKFLYKIKIVDSPLCVFCKDVDETIEHLFWSCEYTQNLLQDVDNLFLSSAISLPLSKTKFIFGDVSKLKKGDPVNLIFLYIKQYIYNARCFCKELSTQALMKKLCYMFELERVTAVRLKQQQTFDTNWNPYKTLLTRS